MESKMKRKFQSNLGLKIEIEKDLITLRGYNE